MKKLFLLAILALGFAFSATAQEKSLVMRNGNTYYINQDVYTKMGFKSFLQDNCIQAYNKFNYGYNLSIAGWCCLGAGVAANVAGLGCLLASGLTNQPSSNTLVQTGIALSYTGLVVELVSVPLIAVGYTKMHNSVDIYNMTCAKPKAVISLDATTDGIGLGMKF